MGIITDGFKLRKSWKKQFPENLQQGASGGNRSQVCISLPETVGRCVDADTRVGLWYQSSNEAITSSVRKVYLGCEIFGAQLLMTQRKVSGNLIYVRGLLGSKVLFKINILRRRQRKALKMAHLVRPLPRGGRIPGGVPGPPASHNLGQRGKTSKPVKPRLSS